MEDHGSSREIFTGAYRLLYFDGRGQRSERIVDARSISRWGHDECDMLAFCRERKAERTFMASRIGEMMNLETGEYLVELGGVKFDALDRWRRYVVRNYLFGKGTIYLTTEAPRAYPASNGGGDHGSHSTEGRALGARQR